LLVHHNPDFIGSEAQLHFGQTPPRLWDPLSGQLVAVLEGHQGSLVFAEFDSAGERVLTAALDQIARLWDAASGQPIHVLKVYEFADIAIFNPQGQQLLTASGPGIAHLWDVDWGQQLVELKGHKGRIRSAVFDREGKRILTASDDGTVRIWRVLPYWGDDLIEHVSATLPRRLTDWQRQEFNLPAAE
jgi:WD40 repeat protein